MLDKRGHIQEEHIFRYLGNEMTDAERHLFEREMQRDPFLAEAVDGFSRWGASEVYEDVGLLRARLRDQKKNRVIWYAAASVLLLVVASVWIFYPRRSMEPMLTDNIHPVAVDSSLHKRLGGHEIERNLSGKEAEAEPVTTPQKSLEQGSQIVRKNMAVSSSKTLNVDESIIVADVNDELAVENEIEMPPEVHKSSQSIAVQSVHTDAKTMVALKLSEEESAYDQFYPEDSLMDEVVVVGYGVGEKGDLLGAISKVDKKERKKGKAVPAIGWDAYHEYLHGKLSNPELGVPSGRIVIRLEVTIDETGHFTSFKVLRSTNKKYNSYAIKIIKEGPSWKPAIRNHVPCSDNVRLKLVFPSKAETSGDNSGSD